MHFKRYWIKQLAQTKLSIYTHTQHNDTYNIIYWNRDKWNSLLVFVCLWFLCDWSSNYNTNIKRNSTLNFSFVLLKHKYMSILCFLFVWERHFPSESTAQKHKICISIVLFLFMQPFMHTGEQQESTKDTVRVVKDSPPGLSWASIVTFLRTCPYIFH